MEYHYYEGVRDARDDIKKLYNSITSLRAILSSIHHILNREIGQSLFDETLLANPSGPLRQAELELHKLQLKLKVLAKGQKSLDKAVQSLIWPFKEKDIEKAVGTIERYKSSLTLELQVEHLHLAAKHFNMSEDIRIEIRAARFDETRRRIISWLSRGVPDPSKEHNLARARYEETTGSWLIESPSFETWLKTENSLLWLNGGGKTLLRQIFHLLTTERSRCWQINPIANYGQQKPIQESLITVLKAILAGFEHVYIVIDGLGECPKGEGQRDELLALIHEIYGLKLSCLHILLASKREIDIEDSFNKLPARLGCATEVSVRGAHVEQDIRNYLKHPHATNLRKVEAGIKEKGRDEIVHSSGWHVSTRSTAARCFEPALYRVEDYGCNPRTAKNPGCLLRSDIEHEDDQKHARRALQWLAFAAQPISLKELEEAVIVQVDDEPYLNEEEQFMDFKDILEILPAGLVKTISTFYAQFKPEADSEVGRVDSDVVDETKTTEGEQNSSDMNEDGDDVKQVDDVENSSHTDKKPKEETGTENRKESKLMVQFAHFSVKEYLVSARVASGPRSKYYIDSRASELEIIQVCFAYLLELLAIPPRETKSISDGRAADEVIFCIFATFHMGNPLYAAAVNGRRQFVEKLLAESADVNYPTGAYRHSLQAACFVDQTAIVRLLLDVGAEVNAEGGHFGDALQAAA
ncbi:hypothetical protein G7Y89_g3916 [Cudoniella acicularis]|uniref:Nephrocystin 3-like N-terminal domain-containing protein n=1 Tax=Cudoniella acicularis TaxID=354080 RepID=A0A8H4RQF8_9HELO|nr:hypothetical protein G7Y89_g3916 [Cudoniella acicularis]